MEHGISLKASSCKKDHQIDVNPNHKCVPSPSAKDTQPLLGIYHPSAEALRKYFSTFIFHPGWNIETILLMLQLLQAHVSNLLSNHIALSQRPSKFCQHNLLS